MIPLADERIYGALIPDEHLAKFKKFCKGTCKKSDLPRQDTRCRHRRMVENKLPGTSVRALCLNCQHPDYLYQRIELLNDLFSRMPPESHKEYVVELSSRDLELIEWFKSGPYVPWHQFYLDRHRKVVSPKRFCAVITRVLENLNTASLVLPTVISDLEKLRRISNGERFTPPEALDRRIGAVVVSFINPVNLIVDKMKTLLVR